MKDFVTKTDSQLQLKTQDMISAAILHICMLLLGFISSRAVVFGNLMPFGISFMAGCGSVYIPSIAIGAFLGYFVPAIGQGGFRYLATLFAILAVRLIISGYRKISESAIFLSIISAVANVMTGLVTFNGEVLDGIKLFAESVLCGAGTFFVCKVVASWKNTKSGLSGEELAGLLIVINIALIGIVNVKAFDISLGRTLGIFLILISAKYGGTLAGAVCGIAFSFSAVLTGDFSVGYGIYALAGMLAGIFRAYSKYAQIAAALACGLIGMVTGPMNETAKVFIAEIIIASVLFVVLPRGFSIMLGKIFSCYPRVTVSDGVKETLTMRLDVSANALQQVSQTVEQVSRELSKINKPDFPSVITKIENEACSGCKLRIHCWETKSQETNVAVMQMISSVKQGETEPLQQAEPEFAKRCIRLDALCSSIRRVYSEYAARVSAENRIEEVRSVVSDQFEGISSMLRSLARDFESDEQFDNASALVAASALKNINIRAEECGCRVDKFGRMTLEIKFKKDKDTVINKLQIMKTLSIACERDFDVPVVDIVGTDVYMTVYEHAVYRVDLGIFQQSAAESNMCGDAYNCFNDGKGHFVMVLSDGMGTGGRAAVDGAMASGLMSKMVKAGFGYNCALKILNSSMLFKSTDESLATVDIASIDLFTGDVELYKAGAAPTLVRRNGKTGKAVSTSLPVGILRDVAFDRAGIKLKSGDILLLISDGAATEGIDWIRAELESWRDGSAADLSRHICECARRRRSDNHQDDITVMAAILQKAV